MLIITGSDDNYVPGVLVLIASAAFHNPDARFAVLDMGITPENRMRIDRLAERLGVEIRRVEISNEAFAKIPVVRKHLTRSTYLRLLIPNLFPAEERVVYMDCDMVVLDGLSELESVPLGDAIIAAVPCPSPDDVEVAATGHVRGTYVNAGLLVMNLPVWRKEKIAEQCLGLLADPMKHLLSEDQSAINIVAKGRMVLLPSRYNVYSDPNSYKTLGSVPSRPAVIHYVVNNKPWTRPASMGRLWLAHAERIADVMPARQKLTFRRRLSQINRSRKMTLGLILRRPKYIAKNQVAKLMNDKIVDDYLARIQ